MLELQDTSLEWVAHQPAATGLVIFAAGLLYGFVGFRMFSGLLLATCAALGYGAGSLTAALLNQPDTAFSLLGAGAGLLLAAKAPRLAVVVGSGCVWALLGAFLVDQCGARTLFVLMGCGLTGSLGALFAYLCPRSMTVILTTLQGAVLMLVGFTGAATHVLPSIGTTFLSWASSTSWLVPVMLAMLFTMTYSIQTMSQQGDIQTGTC